MTTIFFNFLFFFTLLLSIFSITSKNPVFSILFLISTFVSAAGYLILIGVTFIGLSYIIVYIGAIAVLFLFVIMMINVKLTDILETGNQYTKAFPLAFLIVTLFIYIFSIFIPFFTTSTINTSTDYSTSILNLINSFIIFNTPSQYGGVTAELNDGSLNTLFNLITLNNYSNSFYDILVSLDTTNLETLNINKADSLFSSMLQIEALGFNLYTNGALLLIISGFILLLAMFSAIIITKDTHNKTNI